MRLSLLTGLAALTVLVVAAGLSSVDFAEAESLPDQYQKIQEALPGVEISSIEPSPIPGLLQMSVGTDIYYVSEDGDYFVMGDMFSMATRENLTEAGRNSVRAAYLDKVGANDGVIFPAAEEKFVITVFTDIDCGYCRKLHREIAGYNDLGISVRYLFFPRRGPGSDSWAKADAVWCSIPRNDALTAAKNGEVLEPEDCGETPVGEHYQLGKDLGIAGTPAIFNANGQLISGYHSPEDLLDILERT